MISSNVLPAIDVAFAQHSSSEERLATKAPNQAKALVSQLRTLPGVRSCVVHDRSCDMSYLEVPDITPNGDRPWLITTDIGSEQQIIVSGIGEDAADSVRLLTAQARHWATDNVLTTLARRAQDDAHAREQLQAMRRQAVVGTMMVGLLHEIASSMTIASLSRLMIDDVLKEVELPEDVVESLGYLSTSTAHVLSLFDAMRTLLHSGKVNPRSYEVSGLIEKVKTLCSAYIMTRATFEVSSIPAARVYVAEPLFLQVLVGLLKNATEATPQGGCIRLDVTIANKTIHFAVSDDGPGVPLAMVPTLFDAFATSKSTTGGTGLGLAIAAQVVEEMDGTIAYSSHVSRGALFTVSLPLHD